MPNRRTFLACLLGPLAAGALDRQVLQALQGHPPAPIPPVSWSCPMHAEVVDDKAGKCPICGMTLQPVRLALVWSCPIHPDVSEPGAGRCRRCGRDLLRVTKALSFTCRVHPKIDVVDPGRCPICRRTLVAKYTIRPHGDHNPKHGGYFLMASNNWHIEMTHPSVSVFRLYVYDDYSKPFAPRGLTARIIEAPDAAGRRADVSIAFVRPARARYLEARVTSLGVPATIAAKVRFEAGDKEYRFDFVFPEYSREPATRSPGRPRGLA
ncbi:MAG TPA: heavy metal-binding domain-containing protein [Vicinamibacterales bacterium]